MRITCPSCAAEYEVAPAMLAARRMVRCARCGQDWAPPAEDAGPREAARAEPAPPPPAPSLATPPPPPAPPPRAPEPPPRAELPEATITAPPAPAIPVPIPPPQRDAAPPARRRRAASVLVLACWAASLLLLGGLAWAGYEWRKEVVRMWPPSERLYAKLGLLPPR